MTADDACCNCKFFLEDEDSVNGACRRYPPTAHITDSEDVTIFPSMPADWWCGEFARKVN